jgi:hypothetical protein
MNIDYICDNCQTHCEPSDTHCPACATSHISAYCGACGHPLNGSEVRMGFCQNCRSDLEDETA